MAEWFNATVLKIVVPKGTVGSNPTLSAMRTFKPKTIMNKKLLLRIEELFNEKLQAKTGWGRNEIMQAYKDCVNHALMEILD